MKQLMFIILALALSTQAHAIQMQIGDSKPIEAYTMAELKEVFFKTLPGACRRQITDNEAFEYNQSLGVGIAEITGEIKEYQQGKVFEGTATLAEGDNVEFKCRLRN